MTALDEAAWKGKKADGFGWGERHGRMCGLVGGTQGVCEEGVEDVGEKEFLVLLFVVNAEFNAGEGFVGRAGVEQALDGGVDVGAIAKDFFEAGPGE